MDLICFSHLRWDNVRHRPRHLMKRAANNFRVYYFEEPLLSQNPDGYGTKITAESVHIITPNLKEDHPIGVSKRLESIFRAFMQEEHIMNYIFWYYTPIMLQFSEGFKPKLIIYDCMDQLSAFINASPLLESKEKVLISKANIVFAAGTGLYHAKKEVHPNVTCFPGSVEYEHFVTARNTIPDPEDQKNIGFPRLGYFGIIDERFDFDLIEKAAALQPEFQFIIMGPVVKINPDTLPQEANIHYLGIKDYEDLPQYLSNWSVGIIPYLVNEANKFLSPVKTSEMMAAGLPVIATALPDVVSTYEDTDLVCIIRDEVGLINCVEDLSGVDKTKYLQQVDEILATNNWNTIWQHMEKKILIALNDVEDKTAKMKTSTI